MPGPAVLAPFVAFGAGLLSFLSPCVLPLFPGYMSYISGLSAQEVKDPENRHTVIVAALLFVFGFALVFVATGATASYIGHAVSSHLNVLTRAAGVFIIFMALVMLGVLRVPMLAMEKRFHVERDFGIWSAFPLGLAFGFAWTPCVGPVYAAILSYATSEANVQKGALLLFVYAMGLGLPFLLAAFFAERTFESLTWFKRHFVAINRLGGTVLLVMGFFLITNQWTQFMGPALRWYSQHSLPT